MYHHHYHLHLHHHRHWIRIRFPLLMEKVSNSFIFRFCCCCCCSSLLNNDQFGYTKKKSRSIEVVFPTYVKGEISISKLGTKKKKTLKVFFLVNVTKCVFHLGHFYSLTTTCLFYNIDFNFFHTLLSILCETWYLILFFFPSIPQSQWFRFITYI